MTTRALAGRPVAAIPRPELHAAGKVCVIAVTVVPWGWPTFRAWRAAR